MQICSQAPCLIDKTNLPTHPHNISEYPSIMIHYIYHPCKHVSIFESPQNFCVWLVKGLKSRYLYYTQCDIGFIGSVAFEETCLKNIYAPLCVCLSRNTQYFASVNYTHCQLLHDLTHPSDSPALTISMCIAQRLDEILCWVLYPDNIHKHNLYRLKINTLASFRTSESS